MKRFSQFFSSSYEVTTITFVGDLWTTVGLQVPRERARGDTFANQK